MYTWIPFYEELATKLLQYKENRPALIAAVKSAYQRTSSKLPKIEKDNDNIPDIDPFTVIALFNRGQPREADRKEICAAYKAVLNLSAEVPSDFEGIPTHNNINTCFYCFLDDPKRNETCFDILWSLFKCAINYADQGLEALPFTTAFDSALKLPQIGWAKLTTGLFQIRPNTFLSLDKNNKKILSDRLQITSEVKNGAEYIQLCKDVKNKLNELENCTSFPQLSSLAYQNAPAVAASEMDSPKNLILYGPPGTGKTYFTVIYAVAIIEKKEFQEIEDEDYEAVLERYHTYKAEGLIEFTTFHQSYGYEEFIEGIKPVLENSEEEENEIQYEITPGLFKSFCDKAGRPVLKQSNQNIPLNSAPSIWKVSLEKAGDNETRRECMENSHIRIGYDSYGENIADETKYENGGKSILRAFIDRMNVGDLVVSCYSETTIDAIGVITGEYEWHDEYTHLKRLRKVQWLAKGFEENILDINNGLRLNTPTAYRLNHMSVSDVINLALKHSPATAVEEEKKNYVFIIDEINRGNISKIFGELITLIEPSKRIGQPEGMRVRLPYSQQLFGVPDNVFLIGTMNTADRSIATIDTALRRRFRFREMLPDAEVLDGIFVDDVSIKDMLIKMNQRISILYDREHTLGHAYFMPLLNEEHPTIKTLGRIFEDSIIPLLQEYFYEDYEKIRLVLGDNNKTQSEDQFITARPNNYSEIFGNADLGLDESNHYEINKAAFQNIEAYRKI